MSSQDSDLARMVDPLSVDEFFASYWDSAPLVVKRDDRNYWRDLLTFQELAEIITMSGLAADNVRVIENQRDIDQSRFATELSRNIVDADKLLDYYSRGATIVINSLQRHCKPLAAFCRKIENTLTHPVQANVYFTPDSAQGFSKHYDTHDVFLLQVYGCKEWKIYESPVPRPNNWMPDAALNFPAGELLYEITLEEGSSIYIPRGFVHEGKTSGGLPSAHITLGIMSYTWSDLIKEAVSLSSYSNPLMRESLPPGFQNLRDSDVLSQRFSELLQTLAGEVSINHLIDRLMAQFVSSRPTLNSAAFGNCDRFENVSSASRLCKHELVSYWITQDADCVRVLFHGKELQFPLYAHPILDFISRHTCFTAGDLPDAVDEAGKLTILRRLLKEGFLTWDEDSEI